MTVRIAYFSDPSKRLGSFMEDLIEAIDQAVAAGDGDSADILRRFVLVYLEKQLRSKSVNEMDRYLAQRATWHTTDLWNVYRIPGTPSICYAVRLSTDGAIDMFAIGACFKYPDEDPEVWWDTLIKPRVRSLI